MSVIPEDLKFSKDHEWVRVDGELATIGVTDYAQTELGDIVYVEMPSVGVEFDRMDVIGNIEAVKTVVEFYTPLSGRVEEVNQNLEDSPEIINQDPYGEGWIVKLTISDPAEIGGLLDPVEYGKLAGSE